VFEQSSVGVENLDPIEVANLIVLQLKSTQDTLELNPLRFKELVICLSWRWHHNNIFVCPSDIFKSNSVKKIDVM